MRRLLTVTLTALVTACVEGSGPVVPPPGPPPAPGAQQLVVRAVTTGRDQDPDGYLVSIDDGTPVRVGANAQANFGSVTPGPHRVAVSNLSRWCRMAGDTISTVEMRASTVFNLQLQVDCPANFRDLLVYAVGTELRFVDFLAASPSLPDRLGFTSINCAPEICLYPAISPDGRRLAYVRGSAVRVLEARTGTTIELTNSTAAWHSPVSWSPDGQFVAYADWTSPARTATALFIRRSDGSRAPVQLTFGDASVTFPKWSPDGSRIAYLRRGMPNSAQQLATVTRDGGNVQVLSGAFGPNWPDWAPSGQLLVYVGGDGMRRIYADGNGDQRFSTVISAAEPTYSRDGARIALTMISGCDKAIGILGNDGVTFTRITDWQSGCGPAGKNLGGPAWAP